MRGSVNNFQLGKTMPGNLHVRDLGTAIFYGLEQEGPHTGARTLFIKGEVPPAVLSEVLSNLPAENLHVTHAYLGAGMQTYFSLSWLASTLSLLKGFYLTCEFLDHGADYTSSVLAMLPNATIVLSNFAPANRNLRQKNVWYKTDLPGRVILENSITGECFSNVFDGYPEDILIYHGSQ